MSLIFAHHDMLDSLDVLGLNPVTSQEHAFAFLIYTTLALLVVRGLAWAKPKVLRLVRTETKPAILMSKVEQS